MTQADNHSAEPTFNLPEMLARVDNDREFLCELLEIFKKEAPPLLLSLQEAVSCENMKLVEAEAHNLKGMFATLSATRAASAASQLEQMGRGGVDRSGLRERLAAIEYELAALLTELNNYIAEGTHEDSHRG